jgi:hypothetical protein
MSRPVTPLSAQQLQNGLSGEPSSHVGQGPCVDAFPVRQFLIGTETKVKQVNSLLGLRRTARRTMHLSPIDAILAVATLSTAFLAEILVFVALGLI